MQIVVRNLMFFAGWRMCLIAGLRVDACLMLTSIIRSRIRSYLVMPYSTGCKTPLSNFEANSSYKDVSDPEIMVAFPVIDDPDSASFIAWTTAPWTLPSNLALCVNANFVYVKVLNKINGKVFVVAESRLSELPVEKVKKGLADGAVGGSEKSTSKPKSDGKTKNDT